MMRTIVYLQLQPLWLLKLSWSLYGLRVDSTGPSSVRWMMMGVFMCELLTLASDLVFDFIRHKKRNICRLQLFL